MSKLKTQIDRPTLGHLITFCDYAQSIHWDDKALTTFVHDQLKKLGDNCKKKKEQKKATIAATAADIVAMQTLIGAFGTSGSALVIREFFINPIVKQME